MKRRLAVILMADMVDYTRLMEADQAETIGLIHELRERWLEPEAARRDGEVLKRMGDGWIIAFASVTDAVETARAVQTALADHPAIKLRVAAHLGEIADDGTDLYGTGINITARLQTEAPPGGVMISEDLHRQLDIRLAESFSDAGTFELKNIAQPMTGFQWRPSAPYATAVDDLPVIGVEPFTAVPDWQDTAEAAADLHEQLVFRLSRRTGIRVLSLDAEGEGTPTDLLRGRLRVSGSTAKLTLSLILRETARVLWSDVYEGAADDLFDLTDRAAGRADGALRLEINAFDGERIADLPDEALSASELRTRAAHCFYTATIEGYERATDLIDRSLRLAPGNPMGLAMWAHAQTRLIRARFEKGDPVLVSEIAARADAAVQAAPRSDFIGKTRAEVRVNLLGDVEGAKRTIARVAQVNPGYGLLKVVEADAALVEGAYDRASEALAAFLEQSPRDPFRPFLLYMRSLVELLAGRPDSAAQIIQEAIELRPTCRTYWLLLAEIHRRAGDGPAEERARATAVSMADEPDLLAPELSLPDNERGLMARLAPATADPEMFGPG